MKTLFLLIFILSCQSSKFHWSYKEPQEWRKESEVCTQGLKQSPVELYPSEKALLPEVSFNDQLTNFDKTQVHGSLKFTPKESNWILLNDKKYEFAQVHFHTPSEHQIRGKSYPMEAHFVHQGSNGELAVIGVLFQLGKTNKNIEDLLQGLSLNPYKIMPKKKSSFRYDGSLTTPPCSEGVKWVVLKKPISLSPDQLKNFTLEGNTNRPIRPLNERKILLSQ